jgi:hypothetical protein
MRLYHHHVILFNYSQKLCKLLNKKSGLSIIFRKLYIMFDMLVKAIRA